VGLSAFEAHVRGDLLVAVEGDVVDQHADHAFAFALGSCGIVPEPGEVAGECHHLRALLVGEACVAVGACAVVVVLGFGEVAELLVPVGLERVGDEPVVGVDGEVAAAREGGLVAGALDVPEPQLVGSVGALLELGGDAERDLERERCER
jgi:hypothetical protein